MLFKAFIAISGGFFLKFIHSLWNCSQSIPEDLSNLTAFYNALEDIKSVGLINAIKKNSENPDSNSVLKQIFDTYKAQHDASKPVDNKEILKYAAEVISGVSSTSLYNYFGTHNYYFNGYIKKTQLKLLDKINFDFDNNCINYEALDIALAQDTHLNDLKEISIPFCVDILTILNTRHKIETSLSEEISPELFQEINVLHQDYLNDSVGL
jgi:hypothetical protein